MDIALANYKPQIQAMSTETMFSTLEYIKSIEKKHVIPTPSWIQLRKLKFVVTWLENKSHKCKNENENKIKPYFTLQFFTIKQLLHEVYSSKLFSRTEIFLAIEIINEKLLAENENLKSKLQSMNK